MRWKMKVEFKPHGTTAAESIQRIETAIGVELPESYRAFLATTGGGYVRDGLADCTIPTPFGAMNITEFASAQGISELLDSAIAPRNMICIGEGHFGMTTCLSIAGIDHGQIFALDTEMRYFWTPDQLAALPGLAESIKHFFELRESDELPERPWGYENCYHVADSFDEFLSKLYTA